MSVFKQKLDFIMDLSNPPSECVFSFILSFYYRVILVDPCSLLIMAHSFKLGSIKEVPTHVQLSLINPLCLSMLAQLELSLIQF